MSLYEDLMMFISDIKDPSERKLLAPYATASSDLESLLSEILAKALTNHEMDKQTLKDTLCELYYSKPTLVTFVTEDAEQQLQFDFSAHHISDIVFFRKGYHALQTYRLSHQLKEEGKHILASWLHHRATLVFQVDIHPTAQLGRKIVLDHATGIVIGETSIIGDQCNILHNVTLGSTTKHDGKRHPEVGSNVTIGAGSTILGCIKIADSVTIAASSLVVKDVEKRSV